MYQEDFVQELLFGFSLELETFIDWLYTFKKPHLDQLLRG